MTPDIEAVALDVIRVQHALGVHRIDNPALRTALLDRLVTAAPILAKHILKETP